MIDIFVKKKHINQSSIVSLTGARNGHGICDRIVCPDADIESVDAVIVGRNTLGVVAVHPLHEPHELLMAPVGTHNHHLLAKIAVDGECRPAHVNSHRICELAVCHD